MTDSDRGRRTAGSLESEVMLVLQQSADALSATDVQRRLSAELAYTTVLTILTRMHAKGVLTRTKVGRSFVYRPVDDEAGLVARRMHQVMASEPDREAVLARFLGTLSENDERLLRELLDDADPDTKGG
jgi:predicted transcriptional regulator